VNVPGPPALLVLEDGTTFRGTAYGAEGEAFGEAVFNTGMTGYQETLTDPSYCRQIVAMTAPHIGNTGVNDEDCESRRTWVSGFVIRNSSPVTSSWRASRSLDDDLRAAGIIAIAISGTRALTLHLRERGAMRAAISSTGAEPDTLAARVRASPPMIGADLAREVTTPEPYVVAPPPGVPVRFRVAAVDLGIKAATPAALAGRGCEVRVLPATSSATEILALSPDGVFFSNGPGDPAACGYAVDAMRGVLAAGVPLFGICLGSQVLGRALGLSTYKLRFGHRGCNQPVKDLQTGKVQITSHNHGFAVSMPASPAAGPAAADGDRQRADTVQAAGPPPDGAVRFDTEFGTAEVTHINLNDGVVEGLRLLGQPAFAVQYHPEAAPGPHDAVGLFDDFCDLMERAR
jgi:carbamoyl-phosphate synthase small subunit